MGHSLDQSAAPITRAFAHGEPRTGDVARVARGKAQPIPLIFQANATYGKPMLSQSARTISNNSDIGECSSGLVDRADSGAVIAEQRV
jgi:hypothetical protein